jgi:Xaa-Pro dipeptidase
VRQAYLNGTVGSAKRRRITGCATQGECTVRDVESNNLIRPGLSALEINDAIYALAAQKYGISRFTGINAMCVLDAMPWRLPTRILPTLPSAGQHCFSRPWACIPRMGNGLWQNLRSRQRSAQAQAPSRHRKGFCQGQELLSQEFKNWLLETGWEYGGPIAGHLIGVFPHEKISGGQDHALRPSRKSHPSADIGRQRPQAALDPGNPFCRSSSPDWGLLRRIADTRMISHS